MAKALASGSDDNTARYWDTAWNRRPEGHRDWISVVSLLASWQGACFRFRRQTSQIRFWDSTTGWKPTLGSHHDRILCGAAFSPAGNGLAPISDAQYGTRARKLTLEGHHDWIRALWPSRRMARHLPPVQAMIEYGLGCDDGELGLVIGSALWPSCQVAGRTEGVPRI
jgi:hypothetical protein